MACESNRRAVSLSNDLPAREGGPSTNMDSREFLASAITAALLFR